MRINGLRSLTGVLKGKSLSEEQRARTLRAQRAQQDVLVGVSPRSDGVGDRRDGSRRDRSSPAPSKEEMVPGYGRRVAAADYPASTLQSSFFFSRSETDLGRHRADPTQHRRRARARAAPRTGQ